MSDIGETRVSRRNALILTWIVCLALAVRVLPISLIHYLATSDEIFSYYEQAHRLVFGSGIVPWEYHEGTRSWFLPIALAGVMYICNLFSDSPHVYFFATHALLGMLSLSVVYVAYRYVPPRLSEVGWLSAALLCALFPFLALFGALALTEVVATHFVFIAFIVFRQRWASRAPLQFVAIGVLLGLAFGVRFQLAPLLLVTGCYFCGFEIARWWRVGIGFAISILVVDVILDAITWGMPFHSLWASIHANVAMGVADYFGTSSFLGYFSRLLDYWPAVTPLVLVLLIGAARQPIFFLGAMVVLLSHSFIPHKEFRFLYPALCFAVILLSYGIAEVAFWMARFPWARLMGAPNAPALAGVGAAILIPFSIMAKNGDWVKNSGNSLALLAIRDDPHLCGVAIKEIDWSITGGYVTFHRDVPMYFDTMRRIDHFPSGLPMLTTVMLDGRELGEAGPYNVVIAGPSFVDPAFKKRKCFAHGGVWGSSETCIFDRLSGCTP